MSWLFCCGRRSRSPAPPPRLGLGFGYDERTPLVQDAQSPEAYVSPFVVGVVTLTDLWVQERPRGAGAHDEGAPRGHRARQKGVSALPFFPYPPV